MSGANHEPGPEHDEVAAGSAESRDESEEAADAHRSHAFHRSLVVGEEQLWRTWSNLFATRWSAM